MGQTRHVLGAVGCLVHTYVCQTGVVATRLESAQYLQLPGQQDYQQEIRQLKVPCTVHLQAWLQMDATFSCL